MFLKLLTGVVCSLCAEVSGPLERRLVWLPMTGCTEEQMAEAARAGYDTVLWKVYPRVLPDGQGLDFAAIDQRISEARTHHLRTILAIVGESALDRGEYFDADEQGRPLPGHLDPFLPEAMTRLEWAFARIIDRYAHDPEVVAFAPTWGIYGEGGFRLPTSGRSPHALARFNEWRRANGWPHLNMVPSRSDGPNTEYNRFIRFRYLYMQEQWDAMIRRLKALAGDKPVGTWQELYPVIGYLYNMVAVPSADFALYESCFPFQTTHDPVKTLAETMGFRYRCDSAESYRDYYLPLLARKRGEGQHFIGCQLSNSYAEKNYHWPPEKAARVGFDQWEDRFAPYLRDLHDISVEAVQRDVLLVFPTYAAAALSDGPVHSVDTMTLDVLLRMFGCQMARCGSPALDNMTVEQMNVFRLIVVPCSAYLLSETLNKLAVCEATVLFTGCFGQSLQAEYTPWGGEREVHGRRLRYVRRPAGTLDLAVNHALTARLDRRSASLPEDEIFEYVQVPDGVRVCLRCGGYPVLSTARQDRFIFIHGHVFAGLAFDPERKPPSFGRGSADPSANEVDMWGPYSSQKPENIIGQELMKNILDHARVKYRVLDPRPRTLTCYLGDHMEQASLCANIAYNNTDVSQSLRVRLPYRPQQWPSTPIAGGFHATVTVPPFNYIVLKAENRTR